MKTKSLLTGLFAVALLMVSCGDHGKAITPEQERNTINAIFQSLDMSPEQFTENIKKQGFSVAGKYPAINYISFSNVSLNSNYKAADKVLVGITYKDDVIQQVVYERNLNGESNPAAYYKLFSDMIAEYNYSNWQGYYEDPTEVHILQTILLDQNYTSAQSVANRSELCNLINNDNLYRLNELQYFLETFAYRHTDNSQWGGRILMFTDQYGTEENPDDFEGKITDVKSINLDFLLERIE